MKATEGRIGRVFVMRLEHGDKVPDCIERSPRSRESWRAMRCSSRPGQGPGSGWPAPLR